jgi:cobalt-zinc-cadmium efflux system outer membrane protein
LYLFVSRLSYLSLIFMKRNILKFYVVTITAVAAASNSVRAAEVESTPAVVMSSSTTTNEMTFDALVQEALEKNPELNFYRAEIAATKGERRTADTIANPELSSQVGAKRSQDPQSGLSGEGVAWSVSVLQTFEYPGRLALRKAIANRQIELAELGYAQFRAALAARTRTLAYAVFVAQENAAAAQEVADRFQALSEVAVQREPAGITPLLETRIMEANAVTSQRRASESKQAARIALLELNQLRGQPLSATVKIAVTQLSFSSPETLDSLLDQTRTNSFELRIRQAELAQQGFKLSLAKNEKYPAVSVGPFYSEEQSGSVGEKARTVGIGLSLPLPLWNRNGGNIETAKARQQQAETSLALTQRDVERRVIENATAYEAKLNEMSRWRTNAVEELREAAELADRHYRLGAVSVTTYVELQKQYLEAVGAMLDTKKDALQAAQELEILTGSSFFKVETSAKPK